MATEETKPVEREAFERWAKKKWKLADDSYHLEETDGACENGNHDYHLVPPAADAGPRCTVCQAPIYHSNLTGWSHYSSQSHGAAPPVPQEAAPRPDCEMWSSPESSLAFDDELNPDDALATASDEPLKALRQWEADTEAPASAREENAFIDGFQAGREAGSERERQLFNWFIKYAKDAEKSWTKDGERTVTAMSWGQAVSEFMAEASRLLGGESQR